MQPICSNRDFIRQQLLSVLDFSGYKAFSSPFLQLLFNSPQMSRSHMYLVAETTLYILTLDYEQFSNKPESTACPYRPHDSASHSAKWWSAWRWCCTSSACRSRVTVWSGWYGPWWPRCFPWYEFLLKAGEISQEDYDRWRYRYPEFANAPGRVNPISQSLSDMLGAGLKEQSEE